jgi:hypothetical protein
MTAFAFAHAIPLGLSAIVVFGVYALGRTHQRSPAAVRTQSHLVLESHGAALPKICPTAGRVFTMALSYTPESQGRSLYLGERYCQPLEPLIWPQVFDGIATYRCQITNYGDVPLLQVTTIFDVDYREAIHTENGTRSGEVVYKYEWPILIQKIDPGKENAAVFYVYNQSKYYAKVKPRDTMAYYSLHTNEQAATRLLFVGVVAGMSLPPLRDKT